MKQKISYSQIENMVLADIGDATKTLQQLIDDYPGAILGNLVTSDTELYVKTETSWLILPIGGPNGGNFIRKDIDDSVDGNTTWNTGKKIHFGGNANLQLSIWQDVNGHVYLRRNGVGDMKIEHLKEGEDIKLQTSETANNLDGAFVWISGDGGVTVGHKNGSKLATLDDGVNVFGALKINGNQVLGDQQAAIGDLAGGASLNDVIVTINSLLARLRTHGLIAT